MSNVIWHLTNWLNFNKISLNVKKTELVGNFETQEKEIRIPNKNSA